MKRILFLFIALFSLINVYGQDYLFIFQKDLTFKTPDGKDYIVKEFPNKSAMELYDMVLNNIYKKVNADKDEISKVDGEQITAFVDKLYLCKIRFGFRLEGDFSFTILFKDGKVRINAPVYKQLYSGGHEYYHDPKRVSKNLDKLDVFDDDDDVHKEFHSSITNLLNSVWEETSQEEDW